MTSNNKGYYFHLMALRVRSLSDCWRNLPFDIRHLQVHHSLQLVPLVLVHPAFPHLHLFLMGQPDLGILVDPVKMNFKIIKRCHHHLNDETELCFGRR